MSVPGQGGVVSFGMQAAKVGKGGTFNPAAVTWYRIPTGQNGVGAVKSIQTFPPETGGPLVPRGAYTDMTFFGGQIELIPRLENVMGWILKGALGSASSTADVDANATATPGVNTHIFRHDPTSPAAQPWMAWRRMTPGATPAQNYGETGFDCKVGNLRIAIPQMGKVAIQTAIQGRDYVLSDASGWTYANSFEDGISAPDAGRGGCRIGGVEYAVMGVVVDIVNGLTTPQQELTVGSMKPDDFTTLTRPTQIRVTVKYADAALDRRILTGSPTGTEFDSMPFLVNKDGSGYAFDAWMDAPGKIGATSTNYQLRIRASRVSFAPDGPIMQNPGGIITRSYIGTVLEPAAGEDYLQVVLVNGQASYA